MLKPTTFRLLAYCLNRYYMNFKRITTMNIAKVSIESLNWLIYKDTGWCVWNIGILAFTSRKHHEFLSQIYVAWTYSIGAYSDI
jgi:hypothetical protein